ncbi:MAG: endonuclease III [Patescibacteria group bacterium]
MKSRFSEKEKNRARAVHAALGRLFPGRPATILRYNNNWELLVAVQLSAQCTDKKVNEITEKLFTKYRTLADYARANPREFEKDIFQSGFYKNKTKNILAAANLVSKKYGGAIPKTMEEMLEIPGVARKTANVVLGNAYGVIEGIAVDTHVTRLAQVLGLTKEKTPEKIERDLMELLPKEEWFTFTYRIIDYGRTYCKATKHDHAVCPLTHEFGDKIPWLLKNSKHQIPNSR